MNWLTTKVMMPPRTAILLNNVNATAPPRGAPRRSSQSTAGSSSAASMRASATGTTISSIFAITHSTATTATSRISNRQAHAAILRTNGLTASSAMSWRVGACRQRNGPVASRGTPRLALNSGANRPLP